MDIVVYGKPDCSWCDRAKALLDTHELKYDYRDVTAVGFDMVKFRQIAPDATTVPVIVINGKLIGGFTDLQAYVGKWSSIVASIRQSLAAGEEVMFEFRKADGSLRMMRGTLNMSVIPGVDVPKTTTPPTDKDTNLFKIYDLDAKGWRSFRAENIVRRAFWSNV